LSLKQIWFFVNDKKFRAINFVNLKPLTTVTVRDRRHALPKIIFLRIRQRTATAKISGQRNRNDITQKSHHR
jgi:hypothetical protein